MERVTWKLTLHVYNREPMRICCVAQGTQTGVCINLEGWDGREVQKGGDVCRPMADSG